MKILVSHRRLTMVAAVLLLTGTACLPVFAGKPAPPPPPPVTYTLRYLDSTHNSSLRAVNEAGVAVGWTGGRAVMRLADGTVVDLTLLAQDCDPDYEWLLLDYAYEINESGQIAGRGWRIENGTPRARLFRYSPEKVDPETQVVLHPPTLEAVGSGAAGKTNYLEGMNDFGDIVLHVTSRVPTLESLPGPQDSAWIFSGLPGQGTATHLLDAAVPSAINNYGQITGAIDLGSESCAFRDTPNGPLELFKTITGAASSQYQKSDGLDINDSGIVAGWARPGKVKGSEDTSMHIARLRSTGAWEDLKGTASNNWATAINNHGDTVGNASSSMVGAFFHADTGKLYALRDLLVNRPANLKYINPADINDAGEICGTVTLQNPDGTTFETAVVLAPVP